MPPEPIVPADRAPRRIGGTRRPDRRTRRARPRVALVVAVLLALTAGPALAGATAHPDEGDGCPPPRCPCLVHLGAGQIAPPEAPTTAATPALAGRLAAERRPGRAERPPIRAHRPRGPPSPNGA